MKFLDILKLSFEKIREHRLLFAIVSFLDLLFIAVAGIISAEFQGQLLGLIFDMNTMVSKEFMNITNTSALGSSFSSFPTGLFQSYYMQFVYLFLLMVSILFVLFLAFHCINWFLSFRISEKHRRQKHNLLYFAGKFTIISIVFGAIKALIIGWVIQIIASDIGTRLSLQPNPILLFMLSLCLVVDYFGVTAYALSTHRLKDIFKNTLVYCIRDIKKLLPSYVFILALYAMVFALFYYSIPVHMIAPLIVILVFLIPLIAWSRVYYINVVGDIKSETKHDRHKMHHKKVNKNAKIIKKKAKKK